MKNKPEIFKVVASKVTIAPAVFAPCRKGLTDAMGGEYRKVFSLSTQEVESISKGVSKRVYFEKPNLGVMP